MNRIRIAESANFPAILPKQEQQLYSIRSQILHFYHTIKGQDLTTVSDANLEKLYVVFSELDELAHMNIDDEICKLILQDSIIQSLLPTIHTSYSNFFSLHETQLARKILASKNPWEMLEAFSLYSRYEKLINDNIQNSSEIKVLAFIGCGPLPVTLLLFSKLYGIHCIGIDKDPEAVNLAISCVKHFGLEKEIDIVLGDENVLLELDWDSIVIAGLAEPKTRIFRNLRSIAKKKKMKLEKPIPVCYRNYTGMRQLLFRSFRPENIKGFQKIKEISPSEGVNNTLVFLEYR